jgi:hypoxanthine phosphoribosyltransferase
MEEQHIPYDEIGILARAIARRVQDTESISHVVGLARGGLIPATIISYVLDAPLLSYGISSYKGSKKSDNFHINQTFNLIDLPRNAHLLVVDDICDTGDTMQHITQKLALASIRHTTACIYTKEKHTKWLQHYGVVVPDNKWIVFPWE